MYVLKTFEMLLLPYVEEIETQHVKSNAQKKVGEIK